MEGKIGVLKKNDSEGYNHWVAIYKDKGHWVDHLDSSAIGWITTFNRNPFPKKVVWKQDDVMHNRFYWLRANDPIERSLIVACITDQTINIQETMLSEVIIMLNDDMINMDEEVVVKYMGREVFYGMVARNVDIIEKSLREYGDYESVYFGEILIPLNDSK